jgi:hypothetical protein
LPPRDRIAQHRQPNDHPLSQAETLKEHLDLG